MKNIGFKILTFTAIVLSAISAGMILYFIFRYGVDVPYMDQWEYVGFFNNFSKGMLTFEELYAQQCEYRQLFPNLIFVGLGTLTRWDVRYEMLVIFLMACITFYNVYRMAARTCHLSTHYLWVLMFVASLFVFMPMQYENWLFGVQIEYFMPVVCLTACMVIIQSRWRASVRLLWVLVLTVISTYSSVNGLLGWFLLIPVFLLYDADGFFKRWPAITLWIGATVLSITFYFADYTQPENFPSTSQALLDPWSAFKYFFGILGNPVRLIHALRPIIIGGIILFALFGALVLYVVWHYRDKELMQRSVAWVMLAMYSILTGGMVMVGRLGFGVYQSLTSRYTSYTLYLAVAVIFLSAIVYKHFMKGKKRSVVLKTVLVALIGFVIYLKIVTYPVAVTDLKNFNAGVRHGKAALHFINFVPHETCERPIYLVHFEELAKRANILNNMGYLRPPLAQTNIIQSSLSQGNTPPDYGSFTALTPINDTMYSVAGHSSVPGTLYPPDAVLLTYTDSLSNNILFALYNGHSTSWEKTFNRYLIPVSTTLIRAWAFDGETTEVLELKGTFDWPLN